MEDRVKAAGELGFIGIIIQLAGLLLGGVATLAGYVVELVALRRLSEALNNQAIWDNALRGVIVAIIGAGVLIITILGLIFGWSLLLPVHSLPWVALVVIPIGLWLLAYFFVVLAGKYYRDAYYELAKSSGVSDFQEAAKWTWWGALLFIVIIGGILQLVGRVFALLGYDRLRGWKPRQQ